MSIRRSISFEEGESELLEYFDDNGKSKIAKEAMKFYKDNKDRVLTDSIINVLKLLGLNNVSNQNTENHQRQNLQDKFTKLKK